MNRSDGVKTSVLHAHAADCSDTRLVAAAGFGFSLMFDDAANASHTRAAHLRLNRFYDAQICKNHK